MVLFIAFRSIFMSCTVTHWSKLSRDIQALRQVLQILTFSTCCRKESDLGLQCPNKIEVLGIAEPTLWAEIHLRQPSWGPSCPWNGKIWMWGVPLLPRGLWPEKSIMRPYFFCQHPMNKRLKLSDRKLQEFNFVWSGEHPLVTVHLGSVGL